MSSTNQNNEKKIKLIQLQKEYILKTVAGLDEMISLSNIVDGLEDPDLIECYLKKMDEIESAIDKDYHTACEIEKVTC